MRYGFDGFGYKYIDSGSGSDWRTRHPDAEPLYAEQPVAKTVTVTVVSAADGKPMNTFKINPAEKTYVRPDHSMFGYVFEPEEQSE
jgi:aconitase B